MYDELKRWTGPVDVGRFRFGRDPDPLHVISRRVVLAPGPNGPIRDEPVRVGETVRHFVDGVEVEAPHV